MTMVDSGIPLGPGLLATWVPLPDPHAKNANATINTATIATNVRPPTLPSRSLFGMHLSFVSSERLFLASATSIAHVDSSDSRVGDQCCDSQRQGNARGKSPFESIVQRGMVPRKMAQPKSECQRLPTSGIILPMVVWRGKSECSVLHVALTRNCAQGFATASQ